VRACAPKRGGLGAIGDTNKTLRREDSTAGLDTNGAAAFYNARHVRRCRNAQSSLHAERGLDEEGASGP